MEEKFELRDLFLREFVKELIMNTPLKEMPQETEQQGGQLQNRLPSQQIPQMRRDFMPQKLFPSIMKNQAIGQITPMTIPMTSRPTMPNAPPTSLYPETDLRKVLYILRDPSIQSIECPGPGIPVKINSFGKIKEAPIILSHEEIKKAVEEFSSRSRIPLIGKIFKAAIGNVIMTAILSDFIGTRFILEKKMAIPNPTFSYYR